MPSNKSKGLHPGKKHGRLTVVEFHHKDNKWRRYYTFRCECGKTKVIHGSAVVSGNTKSCGCFAAEVRRKRISSNHSEITAIILGYKRHASDRGFSWNLSRKFVDEIVRKKCYYCGCSPSNKKKTKNSIGDGFLYSGIDRIDSSKGYTEINVVPACKVCNYAKSNMKEDEFRSWAIRIGKKAMAAQWG